VAQLSVRDSELTVGGLEDVQVAVAPVERDLDDRVQPGEADVGGHLQAPPDRWLCALQPHLDLVYRRWPIGLLALRRQQASRRPAAGRDRRSRTDQGVPVAGNLRQHLQRREPDTAVIGALVRRFGLARRRKGVHPGPQQHSQGRVVRQAFLIDGQVIGSRVGLVAVVHRPRVQGFLDLPAELGPIQGLLRDVNAICTAVGPHRLQRAG
jgi:hypothetical protein